MLVLSRKKGEKIQIGDDITIVLIDLVGDKARIGVEAPRNVSVYRTEVLDRMALKNDHKTVEPNKTLFVD